MPGDVGDSAAPLSELLNPILELVVLWGGRQRAGTTYERSGWSPISFSSALRTCTAYSQKWLAAEMQRRGLEA